MRLGLKRGDPRSIQLPVFNRSFATALYSKQGGASMGDGRRGGDKKVGGLFIVSIQAWVFCCRQQCLDAGQNSTYFHWPIFWATSQVSATVAQETLNRMFFVWMHWGDIVINERILINLAIVKTNWDHSSSSLLDNFMPLIGRAIQLLPDDEISEIGLKSKVEDFSGFKIPGGAMSVLIRRAAKQKYGYVIKEGGLFRKNNTVISVIDFESKRKTAEEDISLIKSKFERYCKNISGNEDIQHSFDEVFIDVLYDLSPSLVRSISDVDGITFGEVNGSIQYFVAKFILHLKDEDKVTFGKLIDVAKGAILTELLFYTDGAMVKKKMNSVEVYFDTTLVLGLLGLLPSYEVESISELVTMLRDLNANISIFDITENEVQGILNVASHHAKNGWRGAYRPGNSFDMLARQDTKSSDVQLIIATLRERLQKAGFRIVTVPKILEATNIDESKLNEFIEVEIPNQKDMSRKHDLRVLSAINQLRLGQTKKYFESCGAIFVTTNSALSRASTKFFGEEVGISDAPVCIPHYVFTMLMWLKSVQKKPDLPTETLIANSLAAMNPTELLWDKYIAEAEKLRTSSEITEDDYFFLARALEAKSALMEITYGDVSVVTGGTVKDVLRAAKAKFAVELTAKYTESDVRRESFFRGLRFWTHLISKYIVIAIFFAIAIVLAVWANPISVLTPNWSADYVLSVSALIFSVASVALGWSFRGLIESLCGRFSDFVVARVRAATW